MIGEALHSRDEIHKSYMSRNEREKKDSQALGIRLMH